MNQRIQFIAEVLKAERPFAAICRDFGISRKTGYKWKRRFEEAQLEGLKTRESAPHCCPHALTDAQKQEILRLRSEFPTWGPKKLKKVLENETGETFPAQSTIGDLLKREGLTQPRKRRPPTSPRPFPLQVAREPFDVLAIDLKGWFNTGDGTRCEPLTLIDTLSRYALLVHALPRHRCSDVQELLITIFREHGIPRILRSDNGPPFGGRGLGRLSALSIWLLQLGILPEHITPGKPQENGCLERFHRTLGQETASPPAFTIAEQQARMDSFREVYNDVRPHEALGQATPKSRHTSSPRPYPEALREIEVLEGTVPRKIYDNGMMRWQGQLVFCSSVLSGHTLGFKQISEHWWEVFVGPLLISYWNEVKGAFCAQPPWGTSPPNPLEFFKA